MLFGVRNFTKRGLVGLVGIFIKGPLLLRLSFFFFARPRRRRTMLRMSVWRLHQQHCRDHCYGERAQGASIFFIALDSGWRSQRCVHGSSTTQWAGRTVSGCFTIIGRPGCPLWVISRHLQCESHVRFTPKSGHCGATRNVRFVPIADIASEGETATGPRLVRRISPNAKIKALQSLSISSRLTMSAMR